MLMEVSIPSLTDPCIHVLKHGRSLESLFDEFQSPGHWCRRVSGYSPALVKAFIDVSSLLHKSVERWWNWLPRDVPWLIDEKTFFWFYTALSCVLLPEVGRKSEQIISAQKEWNAGTKKLGCMNFTLFFQFSVAIADNFSPSPHPEDLATFLDLLLSRTKAFVIHHESIPPGSIYLDRHIEYGCSRGYRGFSISQGLVRNEKGWTKLPLATSKFDCTKSLSSVTKCDPIRYFSVSFDCPVDSGDQVDSIESKESQPEHAFADLATAITELNKHDYSDRQVDDKEIFYIPTGDASEHAVIPPPYSIKVDLKKHAAQVRKIAQDAKDSDAKDSDADLGGHEAAPAKISTGRRPSGDAADGEVAGILRAAAVYDPATSLAEQTRIGLGAVSPLTRPKSVALGSLRRGSARRRPPADSAAARPQSADLTLRASGPGQRRPAHRPQPEGRLTGDGITNLWRSQARPGPAQPPALSRGAGLPGSGPAPRPLSCIFGCPSGLYPPLQPRVPGPDLPGRLSGGPAGRGKASGGGRVCWTGVSAQRIPGWAAALADRVALSGMPLGPATR